MKSKTPIYFKNLVEALNALPGIGKKSATKIAYAIVTTHRFEGIKLAHAIESAIEHISRCKRCNNLSEDELCHICSDPFRDKSKVCIVENAKDLLIIEEAGFYDGLYYVLDKYDELNIEHLKEAVKEAKEIIFAFTPSIASDTMMLYIENELKELNVTFSKIAQGVPTGTALENVDILSLMRALEERVRL